MKKFSMVVMTCIMSLLFLFSPVAVSASGIIDLTNQSKVIDLTRSDANPIIDLTNQSKVIDLTSSANPIIDLTNQSKVIDLTSSTNSIIDLTNQSKIVDITGTNANAQVVDLTGVEKTK